MTARSEHLVEKLFLLAAVASAAVTLLIFAFMVVMGLPLFREGHFFASLGQGWSPDAHQYGIYPMIVGTVWISSLALAIALPFSLGSAALISVIHPEGFGRLLKKTVQLMTGIPTVIYGFVGLFLLVPLVRETFSQGSGLCILSAAIMLALLIAPTMVLFFVDSFENVPRSYIAAADALGASTVQTLLYVILPCAWRGIVTGLIMALGRAMGDTLVALMLAGNAVGIPGSVLDSARALTAQIALVIAADFDSLEFRTLFACGMILYAFTTVMVLVVRFVQTAAEKRYGSTARR